MIDKEENSDNEEKEVKEEKEEKKEKKEIPKGGLEVLYCGICSLPPEYCEFGPSFEKCKPWLIENVPDLYPNLKEEDGDEEKESKSTGKRGGKGLVKPDITNSDVILLPGGKVKKKRETNYSYFSCSEK